MDANDLVELLVQQIWMEETIYMSQACEKCPDSSWVSKEPASKLLGVDGSGWDVGAAGLTWRPSRQWSSWVGMETAAVESRCGQTHTSHCHGKTPSNRGLNNSQEKTKRN